MPDEAEEAIGEVLSGRPRAGDLAEMVAALRARREALARERDAAPDEAGRKAWETRLREADRQIGVLREEQAITEFVELSVRASVNRPRHDVGVDVDDPPMPQ